MVSDGETISEVDGLRRDDFLCAVVFDNDAARLRPVQFVDFVVEVHVVASAGVGVPRCLDYNIHFAVHVVPRIAPRIVERVGRRERRVRVHTHFDVQVLRLVRCDTADSVSGRSAARVRERPHRVVDPAGNISVHGDAVITVVGHRKTLVEVQSLRSGNNACPTVFDGHTVEHSRNSCPVVAVGRENEAVVVRVYGL